MFQYCNAKDRSLRLSELVVIWSQALSYVYTLLIDFESWRESISGTNIILLKVEDWSWWRLPVHMAERWQQTRFNDIFSLAVEGRTDKQLCVDMAIPPMYVYTYILRYLLVCTSVCTYF